MAVSHPLIKDIKGSILKFLEDVKESEHISDTNSNLLAFCHNVEKVFTFGLLASQNAFGFTKSNEAWLWLEKIGSIRDDIVTFGYINSVESVKRYQNILTSKGKLRLLIRHCLIRKSLHVPVEYLIKNKKCCTLYKENSILGDEILSEIFLSVLLQCSKIHFKLDVTNTSFLDTTWLLPEMLKLELVPCKSLGMSVSFANDKAIIVNIKSNSVISENCAIEVGDVLDNLNGVHICSVTKGKLNSILRNNKGQPVTVTVLKARHSSTNELYQPIVNLLRQVQIDPVALKNRAFKDTGTNSSVKKSTSAGFKATYVGSVNTGKTGDVKQIDKAVRSLLSPYRNSQRSSTQLKPQRKAIYFEVGEIGIKIVDSESSDIILKHSYMEISSCGSVSHMPHYFAYIAGNEYCNQATDFTCHIFHIKSSESAYTILQSIGQGFQRTHFAV